MPAHAMTAVPFGAIVVSATGKCLQVQGATAGTAIVQSQCAQATSQMWELQPAPTVGFYQLSAGLSGQCLAVPHNGAATLVQEPCDNDPYQSWSVLPQPGGGYLLQSQQSANCVGVESESRADNMTLVHASCGNASSQLMRFGQPAFVANAPMTIVSQSSGQCVGVAYGSTVKSSFSVQYPCGTVANATWRLQPVAAGTVELINTGTGLCLEVGGQSKAAGARIDQYTCLGTANQRWTLLASGNVWQLAAQQTGMCLTIAKGSPAPLVQQPCAALPEAQFTFHAPSLPSVWAPPVAEKSVAVAAANLPNGKILAWASDSQLTYSHVEQTYTEVIDPVAGSDSELLVSSTHHNMFCPGIANLPDGDILVNGGDTNTPTSIYNWRAAIWSAAAPMNVGRGYEGTVLNADNTVFTLGGSWNVKVRGNTPGELWSPTTGWKLLPDIPSEPIWTQDAAGPFRADNHAWLHVLSGGRLLHAGPSTTMHWINPYDQAGKGSITSAGPRGDDPDSMNGNVAAFDVDMLLKLGGAPDYDHSRATPNAVLIDASGDGNPVVTPLAPMAYARGFANSVVLPNGQVVVVGGQTYDEPFTDTDAVLVPEIWDPTTRVFQTLAPMATPRTYHSTALLLPDGRVWVSGGGLCGTTCGNTGANHTTYEILTPPYLLTASGAAATRPVISSATPGTLALGDSLTIRTTAPVMGFALMRLSSVTHTVNNDQRRVPLPATTTDGYTYTATLPDDAGVLVAGYYMLFALSPAGVPSVAVTLLIT
jgi:galactose oxidase